MYGDLETDLRARFPVAFKELILHSSNAWSFHAGSSHLTIAIDSPVLAFVPKASKVAI